MYACPIHRPKVQQAHLGGRLIDRQEVVVVVRPAAIGRRPFPPIVVLPVVVEHDAEGREGPDYKNERDPEAIREEDRPDPDHRYPHLEQPAQTVQKLLRAASGFTTRPFEGVVVLGGVEESQVEFEGLRLDEPLHVVLKALRLSGLHVGLKTGDDLRRRSSPRPSARLERGTVASSPTTCPPPTPSRPHPGRASSGTLGPPGKSPWMNNRVSQTIVSAPAARQIRRSAFGRLSIQARNLPEAVHWEPVWTGQGRARREGAISLFIHSTVEPGIHPTPRSPGRSGP